MKDEMQGLTTDVVVECINRGTREIMLEDGSIHKMTELRDAEGEIVEDIDDAFFATVELAEGKWIPVILSQYEENGTAH